MSHTGGYSKSPLGSSLETAYTSVPLDANSSATKQDVEVFASPVPSSGSTSPPFDSTTSLESGPKAKPQKRSFPSRIFRRTQVLGWWWEVLSILTSVICTGAVAAILLFLDGKPLSKWPWGIRPNSLVAVFSTIAKAALLVPVSECLSQLKWNYFEEAPRHLGQLQVFDSASRGPWGAAMMLLRARSAWLGRVGAAIMVLALAFEPFAQQTLEFPTLNTPYRSGTGKVTRADGYAHGSLYDEMAPITRQLRTKVRKEMLSMFEDEVDEITPDFSCPTSHCVVTPFQTLGACGKCERPTPDAYPRIRLGCEYHIASSNGSRTFSGLENFRAGWREMEEGGANPAYRNTWAGCTLVYHYDLILNFEVDTTGDQLNYTSLIIEEHPPDEPMGLVRFLGFKLETSWPEEESNEAFATWNGIEGDQALCTISLCAHRYEHNMTINNGKLDVPHRPVEIALEPAGTGDAFLDKYPLYEYKEVNETTPGPRYIIDQSSSPLRVLIREVSAQMLGEDVVDEYFRNTTFDTIVSNMAKVTTSVIQSSFNERSANQTGTAYWSETFVKVRWQWFIMPISAVLLSTAFLVASLVRSRDKSLFKSSALVPFFCRFEDPIDEGFPSLSAGERANGKALDEAVDGIEAMLKRNGAGHLRFVKTGKITKKRRRERCL